MTKEDTSLRECLQDKQARLRQLIRDGRPYVWELRISLNEYRKLETALRNSISSHAGDYHHLLCEDMAMVTVMYMAEWYKRYYKGSEDAPDEEGDRALKLNTEELKEVYAKARIDEKVFVYNASKNPDRTSYRWLESLQILGGLAVQAELKRDENEDQLLSQLCKIFHGEEIELEELKDRNRAVAFKESIAQQHSLYEYLDCILDNEKEMPFAQSDMEDEGTMIPELIRRIQTADIKARREKFDMEWIVNFVQSQSLLTRQIRVRLKPEVIGGGRKQYLGYDRLRSAIWGIPKPEEIGRIRIYLRFKDCGHYVKREDEREEPLFEYHNTGSEKTGFIAVNTMDENTYRNVPVERFDNVEAVMKYETMDANGHPRIVSKVVQEWGVTRYMQVYALRKSSTQFSSRKNPQAATVVIFGSEYRLTEQYRELPVVKVHYRQGEACSEDYNWCPINDQVILQDMNGKEVKPPFFNRNGLYQVVTKKYLKTIKYKENIYVLYKYIDTDLDEEELQEDNVPVMFGGRNGLEVRHYANPTVKEGEAVTDYDLEWKKNGKYVDWDKEEPKQGLQRLRVTVKGIVFTPKVYYVPFEPQDVEQEPIWRDFEHMRICTALKGMEDVQDDFRQEYDHIEPDTRVLEIGNSEEKILVDVYRPVILRELSQTNNDQGEKKIVEYCGKDDELQIPLINCEQFSVRDFSVNGVQEYRIKSRNTVYYNFMTINNANISAENYLISKSASELTPEVPLDYLRVYISKAMDEQKDLYYWNYKEEPKPVKTNRGLREEGIIFQSLKDNDSPRHYAMPTINKGRWGWGGKKMQTVENTLECFETVAEHKTYYFMFSPLIKAVQANRQIEEIVIPLMMKRQCRLTNVDMENLHRMALHFHYDWMLLPREQWVKAVEEASDNGGDKEKLRSEVLNLFRHTPKVTDEHERICLEEWLMRYWKFNAYPKVEPEAETALRLILNQPDALLKYSSMKEYLKVYDESRQKYSEMSRVIINNNDDDKI